MTQTIKEVSLEYFKGVYELTGVEFETEPPQKTEYYDSATVIYFRLNDIVFAAREDPEDGYRSCLGTIFIVDNYELKNVFPATLVIAKRIDTETHDTVCFTDPVTHKTVLEIGTDNIDDYYPGFVGYFDPEAMNINSRPLEEPIDNLSVRQLLITRK